MLVPDNEPSPESILDTEATSLKDDIFIEGNSVGEIWLVSCYYTNIRNKEFHRMMDALSFADQIMKDHPERIFNVWQNISGNGRRRP